VTPPNWSRLPSTSKKLRRPNPNRFLECADAAGAEYIIAGNTKHFPQIFEKIKIVTPQQFLELVVPRLANYSKGDTK
jgi:predicted nucleic acid-binding protein